MLLLAMVILPLSACKNGEEPSNTDGTTVTTSPVSSKDDPEVDTTDYRAEVRKKFESLSETDAGTFSYVTDLRGVIITDYQGSETHVRVPDTIENLSVVGIGDGAFRDQKDLKTLFLPDSVSTLGQDTLKGCDALEALRTPMLSATKSDDQFLGYLFGGESSADNILVPDSLAYVWVDGLVRGIGASAFADCNELVAVLLGDGVTVVHDFAFIFCENLKYVNLEGLAEIGSFAFSNCNDFVSATFGKNLQQIGFGAFQGCPALSSMTLPFVGGTRMENTYLGYIFGAKHPDFTAGYIPAYLRKITILDGCDTLGNYAFFECSTIKNITIPQSVKTIGVRAFEGCTALEAMDISSVLTIRENAFFGCSALADVKFGESLQSLGINVFYGCTSLKSVVLPISLEALPASAFADCTLLESVDFGGVTSVGKNAFRNCTNLKTVKLGEDVEIRDGNDIIQEIIKE